MTSLTLRLGTAAALCAAALAAPAAAAETAFPKNAELHYIGPYGVPAVMTFNQNGGRYNVNADINVPLYKMRFSSNGSISGNRLQPARYNINGASIAVNRFRVQRGDDTIEYSFAPDFANIPALIKYTDDGKTYELKLRSGKIDGTPLQPPK